MSDLDLALFLGARGLSAHQLTEVQRWSIRANLQIGDRHRAAKSLADWDLGTQTALTQYVPGEHYYALGRQYGTYEEAKAAAERAGYRVTGVLYRYAAAPE